MYWHQRADERHGNPPQGNPELLVVRDKVGRPPGELWVSKSMDCDIFSFSAVYLIDIMLTVILCVLFMDFCDSSLVGFYLFSALILCTVG